MRVINKASFSVLFLLLLLSLSGNVYSKGKKKSDDDSPKFKRYEDIDRKFNKQVARKRLEEANYIKKLIRNSRWGKKNKAPFILRLAELYWDQARYEFDLETARFAKVYERWEKNKWKGVEPKPNHRKSRNLYTESISIAKKVLKPSSKREYKVKALYFIGFNLIELGNGLEGTKYLKRIGKEFKGDKAYYYQSMLKLGDYYFDKGQTLAALSYYGKLARVKDPELLSYVLYKTSWCYMKQGKGRKALKSFEKVRRFIKSRGKGGRVSLLEEVEKDMLKAFALYQPASKAKGFIQSRFGTSSTKKTRQRYEYLATLYRVKKQRRYAALMYHEIVKLNPMDPKNIDIEIMLYDLFKEPFNLSLIKPQIDRIVKMYGPGSQWHSRHGRKAKAQQKIEEMSRIAATKTHEIAKAQLKRKKNKRPKRVIYKNTLAMYSNYLKMFPKHKNAYHIRFIYSQLLFELGRYRQAASEYEELYNHNKKGKYTKIAILNSVACMDQLRSKKTKEPKDTKPKAISKTDEDFIKAANRYNSHYPKDIKRVEELKFKIASIYYYRNHFDKAMPIYNYFIHSSNNKQYKEGAAYQIMAIHRRKGDLKALSKFCRDSVNNPKMAKIAKKLKMHEVLEGAQLKMASSLEKAGKLNEAAQAYLTFYKNFPRAKVAKKSLYNALVLFQKNGNVAKANELHMLVISKYPKDQISINSYKKLADNYSNNGEYEKAAEYYMKLQRSGLIKSKKERLAILYNSAQIYNMLAKNALALRYYNEIERSYPKTREANDSLLARAKISERSKNYRRAIKLYEKYFKKARVTDDVLAFYYARFAKWGKEIFGSTKQRDMYYKKILSLSRRRLKTGIDYYGEAMFFKIEKEFNKFLDYNKVPSVQKRMDPLMTKYRKIIALGSPKWAFAALVRAGAIYEHFGNTIAAAPLPSKRELGGASLEDYKREIEKVVAQNYSEAKNSYEKAISEAEKVGVYSDYMYEARRRLAQQRKIPKRTKGWWRERKYVVITDNTRDKVYYDKF